MSRFRACRCTDVTAKKFDSPRSGAVLQEVFAHAATPRHSPMRSWISVPRLDWLRQGASFGPEDFRGNRRRPVIVTEKQADPVELLYQGFRRLDAVQRRRLLGRIARS